MYFCFDIVVDCGVPDKIEHGHFMLVSNVTYYGAAVLYECEANYELEGYARRLCLENGTWSSETPSCKGEETQMYKNVFNAFIRKIYPFIIIALLHNLQLYRI